MNREQWLTKVAKSLEPWFKKHGFPLEKYRVTCGWPCKQARSRNNRRIGECHNRTTSRDGTAEVFVSPALDQPLQVAGVLAHELAHVAVGTECGHRGKFVKCCNAVGLTKGKPKYAMPEAELEEVITGVIGGLPQYPHAALVSLEKEKTQSTRMMKVECQECGCIVRMTRKWLEEAGLPTCACGGEMIQEQPEEEEGE